MRALAGDRRLRAAAGLAGLAVFSLGLRYLPNGPNIWIDEAISVGIASKPLADIPSVLLRDGSPPLYYGLLHGWIAVFGSGLRALHGLATLFALACIPAAFWALRPFGRRAAWIAAILAALGPYLTRYADETRMYTLVGLLSLLATGALVRLLASGGRRRDAAAFALALTALLYTHNWALFLGAATFGASVLAVVRAGPAERAPLLRRIGLAFGATAVAYAPWLGSLLDQARHTGAPWSGPPPPDALGDVVLTLAGTAVVAPLTFAAGAGLLVAAREGPRERTAIRTAAIVVVATVALALVAAARHPGWSPRYYGVLLGPLVLLLALGTSRAGRVATAALAVSALPWLSLPARDADGKSNVGSLVAVLGKDLRPGDVVVATQPDQVPALRYLLGPRLRYGSLLGASADPTIMDWRDVVGRLDRLTTAAAVGPQIERLRPGGRLLVVRPTGGIEGSEPRYVRIVHERSERLDSLLASDRSLRLLDASSEGARGGTEQISAVEGRLYERLDRPR